MARWLPDDIDIPSLSARNRAAWARAEASREGAAAAQLSQGLHPVQQPQTTATTPAASKYRNKKTGAYASKREARRASTLRLMAEAGTIRNLREQVEFLLIPRQKRADGTVAERAMSYRADFTYDEFQDGEWRRVVEDVKGMRTDVYKLKRKLLLFVHGVEVRET